MSEDERRRCNIKVSFVLTLRAFPLQNQCYHFKKKEAIYLMLMFGISPDVLKSYLGTNSEKSANVGQD